jgi:hypothetical protein
MFRRFSIPKIEAACFFETFVTNNRLGDVTIQTNIIKKSTAVMNSFGYIHDA